MDLTEELEWVRAEQSARHQDDGAMLPSLLARVAARALPVSGVALGLFSAELRVPLGASDADAERAERLQFDLGVGPCLEAVRKGTSAFAPSGTLQERWPLLWDALRQQTPYRSVVSVPLRLDTAARMAMDLYLTSPDGGKHLDLVAAVKTATFVVEELNRAAGNDHGSPREVFTGPDEPSWLNAHLAERRKLVWVAIGMLSVAQSVTAPDALALLRAYAFARDTSVDEVAGSLVDRSLRPADVAP